MFYPARWPVCLIMNAKHNRPQQDKKDCLRIYTFIRVFLSADYADFYLAIAVIIIPFRDLPAGYNRLNTPGLERFCSLI
jgi:hypothetical protein